MKLSHHIQRKSDLFSIIRYQYGGVIMRKGLRFFPFTVFAMVLLCLPFVVPPAMAKQGRISFIKGHDFSRLSPNGIYALGQGKRWDKRGGLKSIPKLFRDVKESKTRMVLKDVANNGRVVGFQHATIGGGTTTIRVPTFRGFRISYREVEIKLPDKKLTRGVVWDEREGTQELPPPTFGFGTQPPTKVFPLSINAAGTRVVGAVFGQRGTCFEGDDLPPTTQGEFGAGNGRRIHLVLWEKDPVNGRWVPTNMLPFDQTHPLLAELNLGVDDWKYPNCGRPYSTFIPDVHISDDGSTIVATLAVPPSSEGITTRTMTAYEVCTNAQCRWEFQWIQSPYFSPDANNPIFYDPSFRPKIMDLSADGTKIVGNLSQPYNSMAVWWTRSGEGGIFDPYYLSSYYIENVDGGLMASAFTTSGDGQIVLGSHSQTFKNEFFPNDNFIWTPDTGMQPFLDVMREYNLDSYFNGFQWDFDGSSSPGVDLSSRGTEILIKLHDDDRHFLGTLLVELGSPQPNSPSGATRRIISKDLGEPFTVWECQLPQLRDKLIGKKRWGKTTNNCTVSTDSSLYFPTPSDETPQEDDPVPDNPQTTYTLTIQKEGNGTGTVRSITDQGIVCGADCSETYTSFQTIQLSMTPDLNMILDGPPTGCNLWNGTLCTVNVNSPNTRVTVNFISATGPATLTFQNNSSYDLVSIRIDGVEQLDVVNHYIIPIGNNVSYSTSAGARDLEVQLGYYQQNANGTQSLITPFDVNLIETANVAAGEDHPVTVGNPSIGQLLSNSLNPLMTSTQNPGVWSLIYQVNTGGFSYENHYARIEFYENGTWRLYESYDPSFVPGSLVASGTVTEVSWPNRPSFIQFTLGPS